MMRRRMVGRSIAWAAVGTGVVAGTAGAVHHHQDQKWANQQAEAQASYDQAYQLGAGDAQSKAQYAPTPQYAPLHRYLRMTLPPNCNSLSSYMIQACSPTRNLPPPSKSSWQVRKAPQVNNLDL